MGNNKKYVGMWGFSLAKANEDQFIDGMFPCIGAGFFNRNSKESYMLHLPNPSCYKIPEKLEKIKKELGDNLDIFICGGGKNSHSSIQYNNHIEKERTYFKSEVENSFPNSNIVTKWNRDNMASKLSLDKKIGNFLLETKVAKVKNI